MRELFLSNNPLSGTIPEELFHLSDSLKFFYASNCQLSGTISTSIGHWTGLRHFHIDNNNFSGAIPTEIGLTKLIRIALNGNNFDAGSVPTELCVLRQDTSALVQRWEVVADCTANATTGIAKMACPTNCCTECCDPATAICNPNR